MPDPDYKALCAELADSVELLLEMRAVDAKPMAITEDRVFRARAALAQPEPQEPSDEGLWELYDEMGGDPEDCAWCLNYAQAVLQRWGRPAIEPVPQQEAE
jgi:hypothetical protein